MASTEVGSVPVSEKAQFSCTLCDKKFNYKNGLKRHVRLTHVGEKPFECNICNRRFGYKHILLEHQNLHFGNKPYACNLCDKRFAARSNLVQHRVVHKKPLSCYLCGKRFDKEDQLKKHLFAHPQTFLSCNFCTFSAASQGDLNSHLMEKHPPQVMDTRDKRRVSNETATPEHHRVTSPGLRVSDSTAATTAPSVVTVAHKIEEICKQLTANAAHEAALAPQVDSMACGIVIKKEADSETSQPCSNRSPMNASSASPLHVPLPESQQNGTSPSSSPARATDLRINQSSAPSSTVYSASPSVSSVTTMAAAVASTEKTSLGLPSIETLLQRSPQLYNRNSSLLVDTHMPPPKDPRFSLPSLGLGSTYMMPASGDPHRSPVGFPGLMPLSQFSHTLLRMPTESHVASTTDITSFSPNSLGSPGAQRPKEMSPLPSSSAYPELEEILNYYVSQGRLFRCEHCHILFFERSMYFLHSSLHGTNNPWECGICHKICSDKNEFTIHFVNQQHTN